MRQDRRSACKAVGAMVALGATGFARAAEDPAQWPSRPLRIVVGFPPGQSSDILARIYAEELGRAIGNMDDALARVRARMLVLPCRQNRLLGLASAQRIAQGVKHADYAEIDSNKGHLAWRPVAGSPETAAMTAHVRAFLSR